MTQDFNEQVYLSVVNKKKAYIAMGKMTLLLFLTTILSNICNVVLSLLYRDFSDDLERALSAFLHLFGVDGVTAKLAAMRFVSGGALLDFFSIIVIFVSILLPCMLVIKRGKMDYDECFPVKGRLVKGTFSMFCVCQLFTMAAAFFANVLNDFLVPSKVSEIVDATVRDFSKEGIFALALNVLCVCVLVPIAEEFAFRGVIFSYLGRFGVSYAIVGSALLFGIAHSEPVQSMYAFSFGLFSAFLLVVTGNIRTSILFHALNNLITVLSDYLKTSYNEKVQLVIMCLYGAVIFGFAFYGLYKLCREGGVFDDFKKIKQEKETCLTVNCGMKEIFVIPLIVFILIYAFDVIKGVL